MSLDVVPIYSLNSKTYVKSETQVTKDSICYFLEITILLLAKEARCIKEMQKT